ncbi:MAG TPA: 23S rRNA (uracil(1939)-C(5))-methyltransferase RlmD [Geobacteraceae bacterium]|nr:23S rRNA (uracil(1939)-C(5))-methyltransferase RlmD [Geobacteraceae bacterium]
MKKISQPAERKDQKKKPRFGDMFEVDVITMDADGYGLATFQEMPVYVSGILPGEQARVKVTYAGRREIFATVVKILRPAPFRLKSPPCPNAAFCDGCPLVAMMHPAQLAWKEALVKGELGRFRSLADVPVHGILPSPRRLHYRNSAKLIVAGKFSAPVIGIYRRNSHDVIDIGECPLHHPLINKVVQAVKEGIRKGKVPVFSQRSGSGLLRYLVVRVSEAENRAMVIFVTSQRSYNEIHHLSRHLLTAVPEVEVVVQNVNNSAGNVIFGEHDHFLTPRKELRETIGTTTFAISPRSFFQVNSGGALLIYAQVREMARLSGRESIIDLYCGIGGISLFLAPEARDVLGIEAVEPAVADAEKNARLNRIGNCRFEAGDAAEILEELRNERNRVDLVVLNPPRKGCDERVLKDTAALAPARIIYVSCSPRTLARDLDILSQRGYRTLEIQPVDMFPQTPHVENVALLEPVPSLPHPPGSTGDLKKEHHKHKRRPE